MTGQNLTEPEILSKYPVSLFLGHPVGSSQIYQSACHYLARSWEKFLTLIYRPKCLFDKTIHGQSAHCPTLLVILTGFSLKKLLIAFLWQTTFLMKKLISLLPWAVQITIRVNRRYLYQLYYSWGHLHDITQYRHGKTLKVYTI